MLPKEPHLLLSVINTKLRDFYPTLDALCDDLNVSQKELEDRLETIGYAYQEEGNRFQTIGDL